MPVADTKSKLTNSQDETRKGIIRGITTGLLGPLATIPIDKFRDNFILKPGVMGVKNLTKAFFKPPFIKGYTFIASTHASRHSITYCAQPALHNLLSAPGVPAQFAMPLSFVMAGMFDGFITCWLDGNRSKLPH